jgi:hypothetical protein
MSLKYIIPFVAGFSDKKVIGDQTLMFCQVRFLCEGGTKIWHENISTEDINQIIQDSELQIERDVSSLVLSPQASPQASPSPTIFLQIKPTPEINTIQSWTSIGNFQSDQLYWRAFNFVIQLSKSGNRYQYYTPVPNDITINPFSVQQLLNTILKVCLDIDIE